MAISNTKGKRIQEFWPPGSWQFFQKSGLQRRQPAHSTHHGLGNLTADPSQEPPLRFSVDPTKIDTHSQGKGKLREWSGDTRLFVCEPKRHRWSSWISSSAKHKAKEIPANDPTKTLKRKNLSSEVITFFARNFHHHTLPKKKQHLEISKSQGLSRLWVYQMFQCFSETPTRQQTSSSDQRCSLKGSPVGWTLVTRFTSCEKISPALKLHTAVLSAKCVYMTGLWLRRNDCHCISWIAP